MVVARLGGAAVLALYVAALAVASRGSAWVALPLLAMSLIAWTAESEARLKRQRLGVVLALSVSALGMAAVKYQEFDSQRRFSAYLKAHGCSPDGDEPRFAAGATAGRYREDTEGFDYDEAAFRCAATGRRITFSDFDSGGFGQ